MNFPDRIRTIIKVNNLTTSSFAEKLGVQRSGVSHILNGRNKPSVDFLEKVLDSFPRVDPTWLLTGKAPRSGDGNQLKAEAEDIDTRQSDKNEKRIRKIVVFYDDNTFESYVPDHEESDILGSRRGY